MRGFAFIFFLSAILLTGCTSNDTPTSGTPPVLWGNNNQIYITVPSGDLLTVVGEQISLTPLVLNANAVAFTISPSLPIGINLNPQTGVISGIAAVVQPRSRYSLNVTDSLGRSAQTYVYIQTKTDLFVTNTSTPEVTSVSGNPYDLVQLVSGGKGGYRFEILDPSFGSVTGDGVFTPSTRMGDVEFRVTDNAGFGSQARFTVRVGVPRLTINYSNPTEGSPLIMQLNLSGRNSVASTISYTISLVSAMSNNVVQTPGSVTIGAGETSAQIIIPTIDNKINKDNGVFTVTLTVDQNLRFKDSNLDSKDFSVVIININPPPLAVFSSGSSTIIETDQEASITIKLVGLDNLPLASTKTVTVDYILDPGFSTVQAYDHNFIGGTVIFAPGELTKTINFQMYHDVNGNQIADQDRLMSFKLQNPINATLGALARHNLTILDPMVIDVNSVVVDLVILDQLLLRGWNYSQNVLLRISSAGVVKSSSASRAALSSGFIQLAYPTTITVLNQGYVLGHGGVSGSASNPNSGDFSGYCNQQISGQNGGDGGAAISTVAPMALINSGQILSGGGGGGGGISAIIGNDGLCSLTKDRISGGSGGIGADTGSGNILAAGPGGLAQATSPSLASYVSNGGAGGLAGLPGGPGAFPALSIGQITTPGTGGLAGKAILDLDQSGGHLISIQNINGGIIKGRDQ